MEYINGDLQIDRLTSVEIQDTWEDLRFSLIGRRLDTAAGRIDYNYDEVAVNYNNGI
jgi:hypothetical protein